MVTNHASSVVAREFPHRQRAAFFMHANEISDELLGPFGLEDIEQRMSRPESVPQRVHRVPG